MATAMRSRVLVVVDAGSSGTGFEKDENIVRRNSSSRAAIQPEVRRAMRAAVEMLRGSECASSSSVPEAALVLLSDGEGEGDDDDDGDEMTRAVEWTSVSSIIERVERIAGAQDASTGRDTGWYGTPTSPKAALRQWKRTLARGTRAEAEASAFDVLWCTSDFERDGRAWPPCAVCAFGIFKSVREVYQERARIHILLDGGCTARSGVALLASMDGIRGSIHSLTDPSIAATSRLSLRGILWRGSLEIGHHCGGDAGETGEHDEQHLLFQGAQLVQERGGGDTSSAHGSHGIDEWRRAGSVLRVLQVVKMHTVKRQILGERLRLEFASTAYADPAAASVADRIVVNLNDENDRRIAFLKAALYGSIGTRNKNVGFLAQLAGSAAYFLVGAERDGYLYACPVFGESVLENLASTCESVYETSLLPFADGVAHSTTVSAENEGVRDRYFCERIVKQTLRCPLLLRRTKTSGDARPGRERVRGESDERPAAEPHLSAGNAVANDGRQLPKEVSERTHGTDMEGTATLPLESSRDEPSAPAGPLVRADGRFSSPFIPSILSSFVSSITKSIGGRSGSSKEDGDGERAGSRTVTGPLGGDGAPVTLGDDHASAAPMARVRGWQNHFSQACDQRSAKRHMKNFEDDPVTSVLHALTRASASGQRSDGSIEGAMRDHMILLPASEAAQAAAEKENAKGTLTGGAGNKSRDKSKKRKRSTHKIQMHEVTDRRRMIGAKEKRAQPKSNPSSAGVMRATSHLSLDSRRAALTQPSNVRYRQGDASMGNRATARTLIKPRAETVRKLL